MGTPLDEILSGAPVAPADVEAPHDAPPIEQPAADPAATGEGEQQTPPAEAAGTTAEPTGATPAHESGTMVPLKALEEERKGRQDWKEKAIRFEEEIKHLRAQHSQPQVPSNPEQRQPQQMSIEQALLNERMNVSEMMVRQQHGDAAVESMLETFQQAVAKNPALGAELAQQRHPWQWMYEQAQRMKAMEEIGSDPAAYRQKLRDELLAELQAQQPAATHPEQPEAPAAPAAPALPRSLATARSAAPRTAPAWSGPTPLNDILKR
ncbi:hypothetical protein [Burkholderia gladioli]|uniref:hypothetical protein n=1 Tax=Burkholderia gladioli TaxID=28095 RepID=UPI00163FE8DC|nr:hypothetical protein [Burkholderia gladioli]